MTISRTSTKFRKTRETEIEMSINLDGTGESSISTGIGFFDHMLESFSKHSAIDLNVTVSGDLHVDMHHTVEDTGIVLGTCINEALADFSGINRFGHAYIPMDETLSRASVDLCKRPFVVWKVQFERDKIGQMDTELFPEFFRALAFNGGFCLHIENLYGENSHHIIESCFKATARALRIAIEKDRRLGSAPASTKGTL